MISYIGKMFIGFKEYALLRPSDEEIRGLIQERFAASEKSHEGENL